MKKLFGVGVVCLLIVCVATIACKKVGVSAGNEEAVKMAESWLETIDLGEYAKSWEETSPLFQGAMPKDQWQTTLDSVRKPLGKVVSRKLEKAEFKTSLPGAPDGQYVVIEFDTIFENKQKAKETVTPMKTKDGKWLVSGYFIK